MGRVERLRFKKPTEKGKVGYRFSYWKGGRVVPRPLDATEDQLLDLLKSAITGGVFTEHYLKELRLAVQPLG